MSDIDEPKAFSDLYGINSLGQEQLHIQAKWLRLCTAGDVCKRINSFTDGLAQKCEPLFA